MAEGAYKKSWRAWHIPPNKQVHSSLWVAEETYQSNLVAASGCFPDHHNSNCGHYLDQPPWLASAISSIRINHTNTTPPSCGLFPLPLPNRALLSVGWRHSYDSMTFHHFLCFLTYLATFTQSQLGNRSLLASTWSLRVVASSRSLNSFLARCFDTLLTLPPRTCLFARVFRDGQSPPLSTLNVIIRDCSSNISRGLASIPLLLRHSWQLAVPVAVDWPSHPCLGSDSTRKVNPRRYQPGE